MDTEKDSVQNNPVILKPDGRFEREEERGGPKFVPPLYMQRYFYVQQELQKRGVTSVVDFGCAECKISGYLVRVPSLVKIALVDIDGALLEKNKHQIKPQACDYLNKREKSLTVCVYQGSVTQLDGIVCDYEAVSMVEIIEHLYPDILEAACEMVFGGIQPNLVIVTTPNADFNQLFPNFSGFRHWDHKFEWTRKEFEDWANQLTAKFPYSVMFSGVGEPPTDSTYLGYCSQSAVFTRCSNFTKIRTNIPVTKNYKLVAESVYPHKQNIGITDNDSVLQEIDYLIRQMSACEQYEMQCEENVIGLKCEIIREENVKDSTCEPKQHRDILIKSVRSENRSEYDRTLENGKEQKCEECIRDDVKWEENIKCFVPLSYFLKFDKFKQRFDLSQLRLFLKNHGYKISSDGQSVVVYEECLSDNEDDVYESVENCPEGAHTVLSDSGIHFENQVQTELEDWG